MSDRPVAERLQVKGKRRLTVIDAPDGLDAVVGALDCRDDAGQAEVALLFARDRAALETSLPALLERLRADVILWLAYPKLSSSASSDLDRDTIRAMMPAYGLDTVAQIAIDADCRRCGSSGSERRLSDKSRPRP